MGQMVKSTDEIRYDICDYCGKLDYCYFDYNSHLGDGVYRCKECCIEHYDIALVCYERQAEMLHIWKTMIDAIKEAEDTDDTND